jgi:hypothetical protein
MSWRSAGRIKEMSVNRSWRAFRPNVGLAILACGLTFSWVRTLIGEELPRTASVKFHSGAEAEIADTQTDGAPPTATTGVGMTFSRKCSTRTLRAARGTGSSPLM